MISVPYFVLHVASASFAEAALGILAALSTIAGIASTGYLMNDLMDRREDRAAGRPNGTADLAWFQVAALFVLLLTLGLSPWALYLPVDRLSFALLAGELALLFAYASPPFRLKERGLAGLLADALYAHAIPAVLAAHTFVLSTGGRFGSAPSFIAALGVWQLFHGLRNILTHQLTDSEHDRVAGVRTFVARTGEGPAQRLLVSVVVPLEALGFIVFTARAAMVVPVMALAWPVHTIAWILVIRVRWRQHVTSRPLLDNLERFWNQYHLRWFPLVVLGAMTWRDARMAAFLVLHVSLFENGLTPLVRRVVRPSPVTVR